MQSDLRSATPPPGCSGHGDVIAAWPRRKSVRLGWFRADRAGPAGAYPKSGPEPGLVLSCAPSPLNSNCCLGLPRPPKSCWTISGPGARLVPSAWALDLAAPADRSASTAGTQCRFCTLRRRNRPGSAPVGLAAQCISHPPLWTRACIHASRRSKTMLWTICVILLVSVGSGNGDLLHRRRADSHPVGHWFGRAGNPPDSGTQDSWLEQAPP